MFLPIQLPGKSYHLQQQMLRKECKNRETSPSKPAWTFLNLQQDFTSPSALLRLAWVPSPQAEAPSAALGHARTHLSPIFLLNTFNLKTTAPNWHLHPPSPTLWGLEEGCHDMCSATLPHAPALLPQHQRGAQSRVTAPPAHGGDSELKAHRLRAGHMWQVWKLWARTAV